MDDLRIGSPGFADWDSGQTKDGSKKRARKRQVEPPEELTDRVTLSSAGETEDQPSGYFPASSDRKPE
jgi:hypothetical protein